MLDIRYSRNFASGPVLSEVKKHIAVAIISQTQEPPARDPLKLLRWRQGAQTPKDFASLLGTAVVHRGTVYISRDKRVFAFSVSEDKWTELEPSRYRGFCMAVVCDKLTTIGGCDGRDKGVNNLLCLTEGMKWEELLPPMLTKRVGAAAVTTHNHLVVAGGKSGRSVLSDALCGVEILDLDSHLWSSASSSPRSFRYPYMTLCDSRVYLSEHNVVFSCSLEELLKSCKPASTSSSAGDSVWTRLADIPVPHGASLPILRGQVLAIGGIADGTPTGAIHRYNRSTNSWSVIGEMPTPRSYTLVAVLSSNELIVVGGDDGTSKICRITEIASTATD